MKSHTWNEPYNLKVQNNGTKDIQMVWLDYHGKPVNYAKIAPGKSHVQPTFKTHPWVLKEGAQTVGVVTGNEAKKGAEETYAVEKDGSVQLNGKTILKHVSKKT